MANETGMSDVRHVVYIRTNEDTGCEHCSEAMDGQNFARSINHYIERHGYRLLHVGTQTDETPDGELWHSTVALLGK